MGPSSSLCKDDARHGAIINFAGGRLEPLTFESVIDHETGRMRQRKVDVDGEAFACALPYMIRLEAKTWKTRTSWPPWQRRRICRRSSSASAFGYLVGSPGG